MSEESIFKHGTAVWFIYTHIPYDWYGHTALLSTRPTGGSNGVLRHFYHRDAPTTRHMKVGHASLWISTDDRPEQDTCNVFPGGGGVIPFRSPTVHSDEEIE
jgi:hypothetical protein